MKWRYGLVVALILSFFSMYPQLNLWYLRGSEWQGNYAYNDPDEVAYAAYLKTLIEGKPRKNDAYTRREDDGTQGESIFSIQFAAPYTIALPARLLNISAPTAMWLSGAIGAFLIGLCLFWLIGRVTEDSLFAFTGSLFVIAASPMIGGWGTILYFLGTGDPHPFHPIMRRYIPLLAFVAFLITVGFVWLMLNEKDKKKRIIFCFVATLSFSYCVFSYFYIWTTAFAWFLILGILWFIIRPQEQEWRENMYAIGALILGSIIPLIPYALMIMNIASSSEQVQGLASTREPYLKLIISQGLYMLIVTELLCYLLLLILSLLIFFKVIRLRDGITVFTLSLILTPLATLNQQIITGKILQPFHYQLYIGNYVLALAIVLLFWQVWQRLGNTLSRHVLAAISVIAISWGVVECYYTTHALDLINVERDEAKPLADRLEELCKTQPNQGVVLVIDTSLGDDLPTLTSCQVLWAIHMHVFPDLTWQENKERLYQHLYFAGLKNKEQMLRLISNNRVFSMIAIFGWSRWNKLNPKAEPVTIEEVISEAEAFENYVNNFDPRKSPETVISYVVVPAGFNFDFSNLEKFYELSEPEVYGRYLMYRTKLKDD